MNVNTSSPFDILAGDSSKIRPSNGDCKSSFITLFGDSSEILLSGKLFEYHASFSNKIIKKFDETLPISYLEILRTGNIGCLVYKAVNISLTVGTSDKVTGFSAIMTLAFKFLLSKGTSSSSIGICFPFNAVL